MRVLGYYAFASMGGLGTLSAGLRLNEEILKSERIHSPHQTNLEDAVSYTAGLTSGIFGLYMLGQGLKYHLKEDKKKEE